jgi:hypothetical protein
MAYTRGCLGPLLAPSSRPKAHRGHVNKLIPLGLCTVYTIQSFSSPVSDTCRVFVLGKLGVETSLMLAVLARGVRLQSARHELPNEVELVYTVSWETFSSWSAHSLASLAGQRLPRGRRLSHPWC